MIKEPTYNCRVCGLNQVIPQYGESGDNPSYNICVCCGVEFGYGDLIVEAALAWRKRWIAQGAEWRDKEYQPDDWDLDQQLRQIPEIFK